jgi:hypothetical protein
MKIKVPVFITNRYKPLENFTFTLLQLKQIQICGNLWKVPKHTHNQGVMHRPPRYQAEGGLFMG